MKWLLSLQLFWAEFAAQRHWVTPTTVMSWPWFRPYCTVTQAMIKVIFSKALPRAGRTHLGTHTSVATNVLPFREQSWKREPPYQPSLPNIPWLLNTSDSDFSRWPCYCSLLLHSSFLTVQLSPWSWQALTGWEISPGNLQPAGLCHYQSQCECGALALYKWDTPFPHSQAFPGVCKLTGQHSRPLCATDQSSQRS